MFLPLWKQGHRTILYNLRFSRLCRDQSMKKWAGDLLGPLATPAVTSSLPRHTHGGWRPPLSCHPGSGHHEPIWSRLGVHLSCTVPAQVDWLPSPIIQSPPSPGPAPASRPALQPGKTVMAAGAAALGPRTSCWDPSGTFLNWPSCDLRTHQGSGPGGGGWYWIGTG